jgi:hypothetical protein
VNPGVKAAILRARSSLLMLLFREAKCTLKMEARPIKKNQPSEMHVHYINSIMKYP